jgi:putative transposase
MNPSVAYNPKKHHRQSHRLRGYDYSFSAPWLNELENKFSGVLLDTCQVMPNHLHAIIVVLGSGLDVAARFGIGTENLDLETADQNNGIPTQGQGGHIGPPLQTAAIQGSYRPSVQTGAVIRSPSLGRVIQWLKTMATNDYISGVRQFGWNKFHRKLWQRDYFDHIIRNEESLERIRSYIRDNPLYWSLDRQNPARAGDDPFEKWLLDDDKL